MNTSQIKTFAINSRQVLKEGVINKISSLGFNPEGEPVFGMPQKIQGATIYAGKILDEYFYDAWMALHQRIQMKGIKDVYEEAAYTWFNRLVAIRIMQKNHLIEPVLAYSSEETKIPVIVAQARAGHLMTEMRAADRTKLIELLDDDSKTNEQFALLIENYCLYNPVLYNCFGGIEKYISILLPDNILAQGGFIDLLNHTSYITDEDYTKSELIGWLYQFYIAEKKDEVFDSFKKGKKAEADDIPAATQIFTPNWIVKYMVQNTLGRIYLDNNPYSTLASQMKYLVGEKTPDEAICRLNDLIEYKLIDPACGSGHILVETFDLFFHMYCEEGYSPRAAIENILSKNIIGIDLDTRAKQLATFALLMKAVKIDNSFMDCKVMPRVLDMPQPFQYDGDLKDFFPHFFLGCDQKVIDECYEAFELLKQADNLGSIMKFDMISDETRWLIQKRVEEWSTQDNVPHAITEAIVSFELILILTDKYTSVIANPPYMGDGNMNDNLKKYVNEHYPTTKADLFSVFMDVAIGQLIEKGKYGMINMQSWMFLSSFESLRHKIVQEQKLDSLLHLGPRTFDELSGEVVQNASFVITNVSIQNPNGIYYRLLAGKNCGDKEHLFFMQAELYHNVPQCKFSQIPGWPIGYWVKDSLINVFHNKTIGDIAAPRQGMATSDNNRFLRQWSEVSIRNISFSSRTREESVLSGCKWFPYNKGGSYRKWFGNNEYVINWKNDGEELLALAAKLYGSPTRTIKNIPYYFKRSVTWSALSKDISLRYSPEGFLFDTKGQCIFSNENEQIEKIMAFLNSKPAVEMLKILAPTLDFNSGVISKLPFIDKFHDIELVKSCLNISKLDWDSHETSWDFKENELISLQKRGLGTITAKVEGVVDIKCSSIELLVAEYKAKWEEHFWKLKSNEEELNRLFIEIYGLQDELQPNVRTDEVTILQQGEISIMAASGDETGFYSSIYWNDDVIIKQFISYAIGCMMGRYRLDKAGLNIAYPNPSEQDLSSYTYNGNTIEIDDDAIIPVLSRDCFFDDNAYNRVVQFISDVFGADNLTENLNFVEKCLGKTLEDYLVKEFWKDHKKMYQNRPIYWLFSSKKGAFQVLVYMHRMNPYTVEVIRTKYLLKHIDDLKNRIARDSERAAILTKQERNNLIKMQKDLDECIEYHDRLHVVADQQIGFDLDDGVLVNSAKFGDVIAQIVPPKKKQA